jgi:hypothetical protein
MFGEYERGIGYEMAWPISGVWRHFNGGNLAMMAMVSQAV